MRNSIAVKFIAVFLATLALLAAVGSGVGIFCLTAADLYNNSVDEIYDAQMESTRRSYAVNLAHRHASLELGNIPEAYLDAYYGTYWMYSTFQPGYVYYTIYNEHGDIVDSTMENAPAGGSSYTMEVTDIRYRSLIQTSHQDAVPVEEATVPTSETIPETTVPDSTTESVQPSESEEPLPEDTDPSQAPDTVETAPEDTSPTQVPEDAQSTSVETDPSVPGDATAETIAGETTPEQDIHWGEYYSYEQESFVQFAFRYSDLPPYTVELYLLPGAMPEEFIWTILQQIWVWRYELFYLLGGGLLAFAILTVYLCCAAGKKPGREEIRAGGLNCIPLDLYAVGGGLIIIFALVFGIEVVEYLLRYSPQVLAPFVLLAGYGCCLILVGFCFACAAQFKTPGGYWWRNSLIGRGFRFLGSVWKLFIRGSLWTSKHLPPVIARIFRKLWTWTAALLHWLAALLLALWGLVKKCWLYLWALLIKVCTWSGRKIARFYSLIPLTWQWLLTAFIMIFLLFIAFNSHSGGWLLLCLGIYLAIVLYGTNAFGVLMDSAKRMGKGDLETKVSEQFLIGSFKEFAGDLNDLADVAVIAAQKQLKSERMKTELITNISHDIKTPLTSIINYVDLLDKPHSEQEQAAYLEVLQRQSQRLKKLIDDLMEMSKASTGNMSVEISRVDAVESVNQALGEFADKLETAGLTPIFRHPEDPVIMLADGKLTWRVLSNLLSNAVKYAMPGTRLYLDLVQLESSVVISLKNISREELNVEADELMERFVRGDQARNTEGSGLGLNIAKSLMDLQKGQLQLLVDGDLFKVTLIFPAG